MKFIKKKGCKIQVPNYDSMVDVTSETDKKSRRRHSKLLPDVIRSIVCGSSGSGKTNLIFALLLQENGLNYRNLYVFSKSLHQPKYKFLTEIMQGVPEIGYFTFNNSHEVVPLDDAQPDSVMIFDDVIQESQTSIGSYFTRGRHHNIDCFYLTQSYGKTPRHLIRDNCNFICAFKLDWLSTDLLHRDHVGSDMTLEEFRKLCNHIWQKKYGFLVIDKESDMNEGRYRDGFETFVVFDDDDDGEDN
jgi:hypothetical protein